MGWCAHCGSVVRTIDRVTPASYLRGGRRKFMASRGRSALVAVFLVGRRLLGLRILGCYGPCTHEMNRVGSCGARLSDVDTMLLSWAYDVPGMPDPHNHEFVDENLFMNSTDNCFVSTCHLIVVFLPAVGNGLPTKWHRIRLVCRRRSLLCVRDFFFHFYMSSLSAVAQCHRLLHRFCFCPCLTPRIAHVRPD